MKNTKLLTVTAVALTVSLVLFFGAERKNRSQVSTENTDQPTAEAKITAAPGVVEAASEEIEVGSEIPGKLRSVVVDEGAAVSKGQIIAVLENDDLKAAIRTAQAQIETLRVAQGSAKARVLQVQADRERIANGARAEERREARSAYEQTLPNVQNSRREYERSEILFRSGDVSREEYERHLTTYENAKKTSATMLERFNLINAGARPDDLAKADAAIRTADAQFRESDAQIVEAAARVREAEARFEKTLVRAPIAGTILRKRLKAGETVSPDSPTGIVTVADTSTLYVRVDLDESDVAKVKAGQVAYLTADAYAGQKFGAEVVKIGEILGRKNFRTERPVEKVDTKILEILLRLNKSQRLPLGLRVDAYILTGD